eukprot:UN08273
MNTPTFRAQYSAHRSKDLLCFLDYFIRIDSSLSVSDLEQSGIPYALIRAQYVRLYGKANKMATESLVNTHQDTKEQEDH